MFGCQDHRCLDLVCGIKLKFWALPQGRYHPTLKEVSGNNGAKLGFSQSLNRSASQKIILACVVVRVDMLMYASTYTSMQVCIYVCMYVCMYDSVYVFMFVCTHVCPYIGMLLIPGGAPSRRSATHGENRIAN